MTFQDEYPELGRPTIKTSLKNTKRNVGEVLSPGKKRLVILRLLYWHEKRKKNNEIEIASPPRRYSGGEKNKDERCPRYFLWLQEINLLQQQEYKQPAPSPRALRTRVIQPNFRSKLVVGILEKWIGYLSGYRTRMVVLENGCLRIYKTHGLFGASVESLIPEHLKTQVTIIGPQIVEATEKAHQSKLGKLVSVSKKKTEMSPWRPSILILWCVSRARQI